MIDLIADELARVAVLPLHRIFVWRFRVDRGPGHGDSGKVSGMRRITLWPTKATAS
jgi:hypothetical protein